MGYASYVPFEKAITGEYIVTFECFIDNILDDRCKNWYIDWDRDSPDIIVNIETSVSRHRYKYFNMLCPRHLFDKDIFLSMNGIQAKEWKG